MNIDLDILIKLGDRFGAPLLIFGAMVWLAALAVRGPGMVLAKSLGDGFGGLCKAGIGYLGEATRKLEALPSHVSLEAAGVREVVRHEGAATREHVSEVATQLRDRMSSAEHELQRSVTATGQHAAVTTTPATGIPATTKGPAS